MNSTDKLAYAQQWFQSKQNDISILKEIATEGQKSLLNDIDQEIARARGELEQLNKQLESESDTDKRKMFTDERDKRETLA